MSEPLPPRPPPSAPPSPAGPGRTPGIAEAFVAVLTRPAEFYASVRDVGGFGSPVVFALVLGIVSGVIRAVYAALGLGGPGGVRAGLGAIVLSPVLAVVACFIGGAVVHVISLSAGGKGTYEQSVRVAAYAGAVMPLGTLLGLLPILRWLPTLYGLYLVAQGLVAIHGADRRRTYVLTGVLAVILVLLSFLAMVAGRAR